MSGIAGLVALDGAPADRALLDRMARSLAPRGPDGVAAWTGGPAGLAHALLRTGDVGDDVAQPLSLDGTSWIVADARIDGRAELVRDLAAGGVHAPAGAPAAELILGALRRWGDDAPARLLGDFAFAAWDGERRRLLCARDLFGVKPLYYAATAGTFAVSNSLDTVRLDPSVSGALDEGWIADFLLHGDAQSPESTVYAAIRQLAPGHLLVVEGGRVAIRRFAALPASAEPLRLRDPAEYADAFVEVLDQAVADRLPQGQAALLLSGGRDSTALAATWRGLVDRGIRHTELRGYTAYHARLLPDDEPRFAALAAGALGIPHRLLAVDDYTAFGRWEAPELRRPQPSASPLLAIDADQTRQAAAHARVLLTGQGADALLRETPSRLVRLVADGHPLRAAREAAAYARWHRRVPRPGVRTWLRERGGPRPHPVEPPGWIDPGFAARVGVAERLAARSAPRAPVHPLRPEAHGLLTTHFWPVLFAQWDPGVTGVCIEQRHPYLDLRLVRLALSIPPAQWYNDKGLLRIGMRGRLPAPILARPKTPVAGDMLAVRAADRGAAWLGGRTAGPGVSPWVDLSRVPRRAGGASPHPPRHLYEDVRPLALSLWLDHHPR